ncbi:membrane-spanning 4-domains subfamily A member 18, partial [Sorex fumeus]|uniref:membrane-spanning 4-domains subfamily A member 18 n=1 Tax=Sorex fumeus TaxID=62283 RepID=UPI0024AE527F
MWFFTVEYINDQFTNIQLTSDTWKKLHCRIPLRTSSCQRMNHLNTIREQRIGASPVPDMMDPQNIYLSHPGNRTTPGRQGQPPEAITYSNSREAQYLAGSIFPQNPPLPGQMPARGRATHGQHTPFQHPAGTPGPQTWPGMAQHTQGPRNTQPLPGNPSNPSGHTSKQFQWNLSFQSFSTFDLKKFTVEEAKTLGTIQILIGLMHIFSAVNYWMYTANILGNSGYLIWGGIAFVVSGSLSVWIAKDPNPCVVNVSVGANIISAICSLLGICITITDLININRRFICTCTFTVSPTIFPFSLLEFILTCAVSFWGFKDVCWNQVWISRPEPGTASAYPARAATMPVNVNTGPANVSNHQTHITNPPASFPYPSSTPLDVP